MAAAGAAAAALLLPLTAASPPAAAGERDSGALQRQFAAAAHEYHVPQSVLLAVSYLQSRWDGHAGAPSVSGGYGVMHLTDARTAMAASPAYRARASAADVADARGDASRPPRAEHATARAAAAKLPAERELPARLRTLGGAARLTGLPARELRTSSAANVRGGAALLAAAQRRLHRPLSPRPADWYGAVAAYPAADDEATATAFADDVYDVLRGGERRTTDAGQHVALAAQPGVRPDRAQVRALGLAEPRRAPGADRTECPASLACEWYPAAYEEYANPDGTPNYGNHDTSDRPRSQSIDYIVVHDTEELWDGAMTGIKDPKGVSWNYTVRSGDGHVTQHVRAKDVAWQAGNWYVNAKSLGVEQEGFLTDPDAWFTESLYRSSARLVAYLAHRYGVPLDRQHILGHYNVPAVTAAGIPAMHTDPGPYFDWQHYFTLLGAPFTDRPAGHGPLVTILPDYATNRPGYTGCDDSGQPCPDHGSEAVRLHTAPDASSPLVRDAGLHPDGGPSTTGVNDTGARASTGQRYVVAERRGDWTAVWYLGQKGWFHDPAGHRTAVPARGEVVVPRAGRTEIPVYGTAYPEAAAYPADVPVQKLSPLPYTVKAGQAYASGGRVRGEYLYAKEFDPEGTKSKVVRGELAYYEIQIGHRVGFVKADDVRVVSSSSPVLR